MKEGSERKIRYGTVAIAFHWSIALLVFLNIALGIYFVQFLERQNPARVAVVGLHESIGISILLLSVMRLLWRLTHPVPSLPSDFSFGQRLLARGTHYGLYFLLIFVPLAGWALASLPPRPLLVFGAMVWPKIGVLAALSADSKKAAGGYLAISHIASAFLLAFLAVGHIAAALFYHAVVRRDRVLQRMLPGT
ncbi:MAG TPA: cytochrome b [Rhizomicrobium sp.]|nr:cytochrome b [Rhizomicrobium sp.]